MRHVVVMVTSSYPRFPGDGIGSFMEPIAKSVAARGHEVHLVAPWHPLITRPKIDEGVHFHFFHYAPTAALNIFGYGSGLRADTQVRLAAWMIAPLALSAGAFKAWRVASKKRATILHGHWIIPGGAMAATATGRLPLVVSAHGSDVFVAERSSAARRTARRVLRKAAAVTACSDDLRDRSIALGADAGKTQTVPYGVDTTRFSPSVAARREMRRELGIPETAPLVVSAGRLVHKKGFEYLIEAAKLLAHSRPALRVVIAGGGDLHDELTARAALLGGRVILAGNRAQDEIARLVAAADVVAVPSIRDDAGNVDGLPNFALEALASATPVVASRAGGLPDVIRDGVTGRLVPERDAPALATAIGSLVDDPALGRRLGAAAREMVARDYGWPRVAERFEAIYDRASSLCRGTSSRRTP
jgi:phosphatidyl-myo-inositol dimannoside synthase